jgi:hypothetical protein
MPTMMVVIEGDRCCASKSEVELSTSLTNKAIPQVLTVRFDITEIDSQIWMLRFADLLIIGAGGIVSVGVFWQIVSGKLGLDALFGGALLTALG